ncbi:class I SAM-dependent methyltransferase [Mycolicibacterium austroafricanum]|uniref:class I SAM-dependent methyltransferase n=1 Tax=Mycolicibacterium austroafricanum TaxID=39687 RepID=UPI001CA38105|nr:class I SAM-dependent methyltransferase [Mycolicibacterium austroafricanum]QZT62297.1 class I SAM-dependent methyltransferase [Mycolicibacterium austroafricanum]
MSQLDTRSRRDGSRNRFEPREIRPGGSTATGGVVDYRLGLVAGYFRLSGRWLDCGSCDGDYTVALRERGADSVVGADPDHRRTAAARSRWIDRTGVDFVAAAAEALPYPDGHFNGILLNEVLEHVDEQEGALRELRRVLEPGGVLAVFSPNRWFPFEGHGIRVGRRNVSSPVPLVPWLPRRLSLRVMKARNYWPWELRDLIVGAGFDVIDINYAWPLLSHYPWIPSGLIPRYRALVPRLQRSKLLRRFGVSTLVVARCSSAGADPGAVEKP